MFESKFKSIEGYYIAVVIGLGLSIGAIGLWIGIKGNTKLRQERQRGYTSDLREAKRHPELYLIGYKSLRILSEPHQERPKSRLRVV